MTKNYKKLYRIVSWKDINDSIVVIINSIHSIMLFLKNNLWTCIEKDERDTYY